MTLEEQRKMLGADGDSVHNLIERLLKEYQTRISERINLVDLIGANENAHTRILAAILGYKRAGRKPFAQSFVQRFIRNEDGSACIQVTTPQIETQRKNIDALLWESTRYAIVIENKINWACDQDLQLENYILATGSICKIDPARQCYVIYLTDNGQKKVSDISLTPKAKTLLDYVKEEKPGRFIELNYREDILVWLKEDVLANCRYAEQTLMSMLLQYIDCLEHRFGLRGDQAEVPFWEAHLHGTETEQYDQLKRWQEYCIRKDAFKDIPSETVESFAAQVRNAAESMVKQNYSLNYADAVNSQGETIRNWARASGFQPRKWYNSTFFEFRVGPYGERIKFQINLGNQGNTVSVQFFNNDFIDDGRHRILKDCGDLVPLFRQMFPDAVPSRPYVEYAAFDEAISSEKELLALLNGPVKTFLSAFYTEFLSKDTTSNDQHQ